MPSELQVIRGTNSKPVASDALIEILSSKGNLVGGHLLIGYPFLASADGPHPLDAVLVSPTHGIVAFDLVEGVDLKGYEDRQDDIANKLEARLRAHRELVDRRTLKISLSAVTFAPALPAQSVPRSTPYAVANREQLVEVLESITWESANEKVRESALSILQSISSIRKARTKRAATNEGTRGAKLKTLEDSIATLDALQSRAVIETVEGVQRIRGLAGSGKTVVLALKAAYLHAQHPEWKIAVTFNTRSLKAHFRRLITNFSLEQTGEEPDWDSLRILNAWGAPGPAHRDGIYHQYCRLHSVDYFDFGSAKDKFGPGKEFGGACELALSQVAGSQALYDAILVDEAQDFPAAFLRLCYQLLGPEKRLVYAYDELQSLSGESLPPVAKIFGSNDDGSPVVSLDEAGSTHRRSDIILEKCYRNSRPVLVTAHALGFGIYRKARVKGDLPMVQMFDTPGLWEEIGYRVVAGELRSGARVTLERSEHTSPRFLEEHSSLDDLVTFVHCPDADAQADYLVSAILQNLSVDQLRHDDIVVINPDPVTTREKVGPIRRRLLEQGVSSHLAGVDTDPDVFFQSEHESLTFTGVYRAKGNEAGMVYIMNAQDCDSPRFNLATLRNRLFTAITRSKAWVRVVGFGDGMKHLHAEYEELSKRAFRLEFQYPTEQERQRLRVVHRDRSVSQQARLKTRAQQLTSLVDDLHSGNLHPEDLDPRLLEALERVLREREGK